MAEPLTTFDQFLASHRPRFEIPVDGPQMPLKMPNGRVYGWICDTTMGLPMEIKNLAGKGYIVGEQNGAQRAYHPLRETLGKGINLFLAPSDGVLYDGRPLELVASIMLDAKPAVVDYRASRKH